MFPGPRQAARVDAPGRLRYAAQRGAVALFAYGETRASSALAGIWNATTPLFTLLVALALLPEEPLSANHVMGFGFAGMACAGREPCPIPIEYRSPQNRRWSA